jgi:hypothetical protein
MIFASWVPKALFVAGVALALAATVLYVKRARAASAAAPPERSTSS